jgi:hypothetical protein
VNLAKFLSSGSALSHAPFSVSDYVEFLHTRESERDVTMSSGMAVAAQTEGVGGVGEGEQKGKGWPKETLLVICLVCFPSNHCWPVVVFFAFHTFYCVMSY